MCCKLIFGAMKYMTTDFKRKIACEEIAETLRKAILHGKLAPGSAIMSERKLAEIYNVTHVTARKATQKLVNENLIVKIHGKGAFVSEKNTTESVGFILCGRQRTAPFYFDLVSGIERELDKRGCNLVLSGINDYKDEADIPRMLKEKIVGGVFITGVAPEKLLKFLRKNDIKHILIAHQTAYDGKSDVVASDERDGGYKAAEYLLKKGHREIAIFRGFDEKRPYDSLRESGFREACEDFGIAPETVKCDSENPEEIKNAALKALREKIPDAIFTTCDNLASGVFKAAEIEKIRVPEDLEFVTSGNAEFIMKIIPSPVIVRTCIDQMAKASVARLLDIISGKSIGKNLNLIPTELITEK